MDGTPAATAVIDQVFLTPRVLDARAFTEYSATLQELLKEASGHQTTLQTVSAEMQSMRQGLRDAMNELQRRLDAATKVLPGIDQRLARAENLVAQANRTLQLEPTEKLQSMRADAAKITADALQHLRVDITETFASSIEQARQHADALMARCGRLESTAISLAASFEGKLQAMAQEIARQAIESNGIFDTQARLYDERLSRRGEELESRIRSQAIAVEDAIDAKLAQIESRLMQFDHMLTQTAERQAHATVTSVIEQAAEIQRRTHAAIAEAQTRLGTFEQLLNTRLEHASVTTESMTSSLKKHLDTAVQTLGNAQVQADGASDRLGALLTTARDFIESEQGGGAIREIRQIAARLETVRADSDFAARQFDEARKHADVLRSNLGQALLEAAGGADQVLARSEVVIARTEQCGIILKNLVAESSHVEQLAQIASQISLRAEQFDSTAGRLSSELDNLELKKDSLQAELRRTGELLELADVTLAERYNRLGTAIQRGTELGESLLCTTTQCARRLEELKQEENETAKRCALAHAQINQQLIGNLSQLVAQSQDAAQRLEQTLRHAESAERSLNTKSAQVVVSASTLFPTAR